MLLCLGAFDTVNKYKIISLLLASSITLSNKRPYKHIHHLVDLNHSKIINYLKMKLIAEKH